MSRRTSNSSPARCEPCGEPHFWWSVGLAGLVAATVAFWPAFRGSSAISDAIDQLPPGVVQAFGLENFGTPAGYLRGNLYELFVPLLLAAAAVAFVERADGERGGERVDSSCFLAQPVDRRAVFLGRAVAVLIGLLADRRSSSRSSSSASMPPSDLRIDPGYLLSTIVALHAPRRAPRQRRHRDRRLPSSTVPSCSAPASASPSPDTSLQPCSPSAACSHRWRHLSPWDWAFGGDPLEQATEVWRYAALVIPSILLTAVGIDAVARRDIATG